MIGEQDSPSSSSFLLYPSFLLYIIKPLMERMNNLIQKRKYTELEESEEESEGNHVECIPSLSSTTTTITSSLTTTTNDDDSFNLFLQRIPTERLLTFNKKNYFNFYLQKELRHFKSFGIHYTPLISTKLLDFISDLVDILHYRKETEWLSCNFLLFYLSHKNYSKKKKLLLALACACVFVAGKLEEETHDPGIQDYLRVVNQKLKEDSVAVSATELRRAELRLLALFEWNLNYTTPFMFYYEIVLSLRREDFCLDGLTSLFCIYISKFIRNTTSSSVAFCCPSVQAIVALVLATDDIPFTKDQKRLKELVTNVYNEYLQQCTIEQKSQVEKHVNIYSADLQLKRLHAASWSANALS
ncbi:hypothetical protein MP638_005138 [Amoeboaphelidium occidentale]|nr:hypothetical protein MP638_005138 [Amoeboaphelidium occidentale]